MPKNTRARNFKEKIGPGANRTQVGSRAGGGLAAEVARLGQMHRKTTGPSRRPVVDTFFFEDGQSDAATAGTAYSNFEFELPDVGLWQCEVSAQIGYEAHADVDPTRAQWSVTVATTAAAVAQDSGILYIPAGDASGSTSNFTAIITKRSFTVNIAPGWDGIAPPNSSRNATVRAFRLGDLPPGVT